MSKDKNEMYIYYEVHAFKEEDNGELFEATLTCTNDKVARAFAATMLEFSDSVYFDHIKTSERLAL